MFTEAHYLLLDHPLSKALFIHVIFEPNVSPQDSKNLGLLPPNLAYYLIGSNPIYALKILFKISNVIKDIELNIQNTEAPTTNNVII